MKKVGNITHSIAFKVFLYIVLASSAVTGVLSGIAISYLVDLDAYSRTEEEFVYEAVGRVAYRHLDYICYDDTLDYESIKREFEKQSRGYNIGYHLLQDGQLLYSNQPKTETPYVYKRAVRDRMIDGLGYMKHEYIYILYVDPNFSKTDEFSWAARMSEELYRWRGELVFAVTLSALLFLISFIWLLCNAGRRKGEEGIVPGVLTPVPLDVLALIFAFIALIPLWIASENRFRRDIYEVVAIFLIGVFELLWGTAFLREFALRVKLGKWWRNSLIYKALHLLWRAVRAVWRAQVELIRGVPLVWQVAAVILMVCVCECFAIFRYRWWNREIFIGGWALEKLILIPIILYCALAFKKLLSGSRALAEGELTDKLDTRYLRGDFAQFAANLNKIGEGISKAVEQRMRSERLKTELITNVSHDLKTPLTSVINYADLLGSEVGRENGALDQEKVAEYSEVLLRQSKRLKKLLDDLLEASKATTGSLEVNPAPCEIGVLLTQAAGEYEARFAEKGLVLNIRQPEEDIRVMADGRHLWRVFDNLLNNICKYAQEQSRVYINVERRDARVGVIFRNMSKYELNVSPQELEERFVRGDKSRNMEVEGNGLGLSIAKSLVELQGGSMEIVTDGDLFKVILDFPVLTDGDIQS